MVTSLVFFCVYHLPQLLCKHQPIDPMSPETKQSAELSFLHVPAVQVVAATLDDANPASPNII